MDWAGPDTSRQARGMGWRKPAMHSLGAVASLPLRVSRDGRRGFCKDWAFLSQNRFGFGGHGFPAGSGSQVTVCNVGDLGSIPGLRRSTGEGNIYPLQYSYLENSMDRERSQVGYSPWSCKESDTPAQLTLSLFQFQKLLFSQPVIF